MSVFEVDGQGALVRRGGTFARVEGVEEIRQGVQVSTLMVHAEVPTDLSIGLKWFGDRKTGANALLGKDTPTDILAAKLRKKTAASRGVVEVLELTAEPNTGVRDALRVDYRARVSTADLRQSLLLEDSITVGG